ncbi:hypothetical protein [Pseudomonas sp. 22 E 5]|uniref:Hemolysin-type calcium-binding repeat-containing protein n=1 Tax=Pseudomonas salomonii TaxID=191391 RepID=A0A7Y8KLQ8_9PSED|nr:hypothetical protein [Pseudomonas salomonii]NWF06291.1 hypothetical protein [Pseudomonas salomonii]CRM72549.1 hypothetical protein [Pseudomonas sp. 22 E 5]
MNVTSPFSFTPSPPLSQQPKPPQENFVKIVHDRDSSGHIVSISVTENQADIRIKKELDGRLVAFINGRPHALDVPNSGSSTLNITTGHYKDRITIDDDVRVTANVKSGAGDDFVQTGGGFANVDTADGDDHVQLSTGGGYVKGGNGNDRLFAGSGKSELHGEGGENFFTTDIPTHNAGNTHIRSSGLRDTIFARAGEVDIEVRAGNAKIQVNKEASVKINLYSDSIGSEITLKGRDTAAHISKRTKTKLIRE